MTVNLSLSRFIILLSSTRTDQIGFFIFSLILILVAQTMVEKIRNESKFVTEADEKLFIFGIIEVKCQGEIIYAT